jgi:hypothetical protein
LERHTSCGVSVVVVVAASVVVSFVEFADVMVFMVGISVVVSSVVVVVVVSSDEVSVVLSVMSSVMVVVVVVDSSAEDSVVKPMVDVKLIMVKTFIVDCATTSSVFVSSAEVCAVAWLLDSTVVPGIMIMVSSAVEVNSTTPEVKG